MNRDRQKEIARRTLAELGDEVICSKCGAVAALYHKVCTAELSDPCPGFLRYDEVRTKHEKAVPAYWRAT